MSTINTINPFLNVGGYQSLVNNSGVKPKVARPEKTDTTEKPAVNLGKLTPEQLAVLSGSREAKTAFTETAKNPYRFSGLG